MSVNAAQYPNALWDGTTPDRTSRLTERRPSAEDFDQLVAEILALQADSIVTTVAAAGVTVVPGNAIAIDTDGNAVLSDCNGSGELRNPIGLAMNAAAAGETVRIKTKGKLTLTLAQWDAAGTDSSGIDPGVTHWLSATAGAITPTQPAVMGDTYMRIGVGLSATTIYLTMDHDYIDPS